MEFCPRFRLEMHSFTACPVLAGAPSEPEAEVEGCPSRSCRLFPSLWNAGKGGLVRQSSWLSRYSGFLPALATRHGYAAAWFLDNATATNRLPLL
jgi:hypothetical protein